MYKSCILLHFKNDKKQVASQLSLFQPLICNISGPEILHITPWNGPFHTLKQPVPQKGTGCPFVLFHLSHCTSIYYTILSKLANLRPGALPDENIAVFSSYAEYLFISPLLFLHIYAQPLPVHPAHASSGRQGINSRHANRSTLPGTHTVNLGRHPLRVRTHTRTTYF